MAQVVPPPSFRFLNDTSRPTHERADSHPLWTTAGAVCWMRRTNERGDMCFDMFPSIEEAARYALVARPPRERCYYAMVRTGRPLEWYIDAEIPRALCATLDTPVVALRQDFTTLMYVGLSWVRASFEAMFGVDLCRAGAPPTTTTTSNCCAWLFRADTGTKLSCHMHVPEWVFQGIEDMSTAMRLVEDVLYTQYTGTPAPHTLARVLFFHIADRKHRRRPGCITTRFDVPAPLLPASLECVLDLGVYTALRHMRMAEQATKPGSNNALKLFQPALTVRVDDATVHPQAYYHHYSVNSHDPTEQAGSISGGDLLLNTMIATERAKQRAHLPNLCQVTTYYEQTMRTLCAHIVPTMVRLATQNNSGGGGGDDDDDERAIASATFDEAFTIALHELWRVYSTCTIITHEETRSLVETLNVLFCMHLVTGISDYYRNCDMPSENERARVCERITVAVHRTLWYSILLVRWHLPLTTAKFNAPRVIEQLKTLVPILITVSLDPITLEAIVAAEVECLARALLGIDFEPQLDGDAGTSADNNDNKLFMQRGVTTPLEVFAVATCNMRLELVEYYLFTHANAAIVDAGYRSIANHAEYEALWSARCFFQTTTTTTTTMALPRMLIQRAIRRGSIWQPHMNDMVRMLRRSRVESTTRFADIANHNNNKKGGSSGSGGGSAAAQILLATEGVSLVDQPLNLSRAGAPFLESTVTETNSTKTNMAPSLTTITSPDFSQSFPSAISSLSLASGQVATLLEEYTFQPPCL